MAGQRYKSPFGPAEVLEEPDIRRLLAGCSQRAPTGVRNRALILTLWRAGLRIDEALTLGPRDVKLDDEQPVIRVRRAKGDKQRTVGLHPEARDALRRWLEVRRVRGCDERRPARAPRRLFCTLDGGQLDSSYVRHLLRRLARKGGVERRVHPHAFRATLAVEMCVEGVPLPAIRDVLGHTNLSVTDAYLRRVFPEQAIDAVRNRRSGTPQQDRSGELRALLDEIAPADAARLVQLLTRLAA
jgi:site-specific recombinase XerD